MQSNHPILAIDHGASRIGLAATDMLGIAVHPAGTIHVKKEDPIESLREIIAQRQIQTLVLGLPLHMDGSEGKAAATIRKFGNLITKNFPDLPLHYVDETLTTVSASEKLHEAGKNAKKQKALIDQAAAMEILNLFLEGQSII